MLTYLLLTFVITFVNAKSNYFKAVREINGNALHNHPNIAQSTFTDSSVVDCLLQCAMESPDCTGFQVDNGTQICTIGAIVRNELLNEVDGETLYVKDTVIKMEEETHILVIGHAASSDLLYYEPPYVSVVSIPDFPVTYPNLPADARLNAQMGLLGDFLYHCPEKATPWPSYACQRWNIYSGETTTLTTELLHEHLGVRHCLVTTAGNRLWIGGSYSSAAESTKSEYMDEDGVWTDGPTMPLGMFDHACLAISANEVLVGNGVVQSTVTEQFTAWILNTDTDTFIPTGPANYNGRGAMLGGPFTLSSGRKAVLKVGGYRETTDPTKTEMLDLQSKTWTHYTSLCPTMDIAYGGFVTIGNKMMMFGGMSYPSGIATSHQWTVDVDKYTCEQGTDLPGTFQMTKALLIKKIYSPINQP